MKGHADTPISHILGQSVRAGFPARDYHPVPLDEGWMGEIFEKEVKK
ncbi:hypothetical protein AciM339_0136 [Aciduliprofundum sp. MAR08-339]|nr:hypothetical protein AciM339_0136 [Aciduliprofundum sp. MAR08-339]